MTFKVWLELVENDYAKWKDIILGYFNLDRNNGLSQTIDTLDKNNFKQKLQSLGEFAKLPPEVQNRVLAFIDGPQSGTVGDLVRQIAGEPRM